MHVVDFKGPYSLFDEQGKELLLSCAQARDPGILLWTYEHNRAHRIHYVAAAADSIAEENLRLVGKVLLGALPIYDDEPLAKGELCVLADGSSDTQTRCAASKQAYKQLQNINVFFASGVEDQKLNQLVADGIIRKLVKFGDPAKAWLAQNLHDIELESENHGLTIRFGRPAFIASLPDEMYL